jgi:hypothetical protein
MPRLDRSGIARATRRRFGTGLIGGLAVAMSLMRSAGSAASSTSQDWSGFWTLAASFGLFGLACVGFAAALGFFVGRRARHAAKALRARGFDGEIAFGRVAPMFPIVAVVVEDGRFECWSMEDGKLVRVASLTDIDAVSVSSQRIAGFYYFALVIASGSDELEVTLGTSWTWGAAEASRRAHVRIAQALLSDMSLARDSSAGSTGSELSSAAGGGRG